MKKRVFTIALSLVIIFSSGALSAAVEKSEFVGFNWYGELGG